MTPPWLPLIGSTVAPKEKPETLSMRWPAASTAANTTPTENAKASPTSSPSIIRPATGNGPVGMCSPCMAIGVRPIDSATARMPRTFTASILEEKSGARMNRGVTRASTRKKAVTWPVPPSALIASASVMWLISVSAYRGPLADQLRDRHVEVLGVADQLVEHPRPEHDHQRAHAHDLRDEGQALLLDRGDGLEDAHDQADHQPGQKHRPGDGQGQRHRLAGEADHRVLVHGL